MKFVFEFLDRNLHGAALLLGFILLTPYLSTGYYCDDSLNSSLRGFLHIHHWDMLSFISLQIRSWLRRGRLYPLSSFLYYFWYAGPSLMVYRWTQVLITLANLVLFRRLLRSLGAGRDFSLLIAATVPVLYQIRNYHDPITSYSMLLQLSFAFGGGAVLLLLRYLRRGDQWALVLSGILLSATILLYEPGLLFLPVLGIISLRLEAPKPRRKAALVLYGVLILLYFAAVIAIRAHFGSRYSGTTISLGWRSIWAFICQTTATLPVVYSVFGRSGLFNLAQLRGPDFVSVSSAALMLFASCVFFFLLRRADLEREKAKPKKIQEKTLLTPIAGIMLFGPSLLVAFSARYQDELRLLGTGYLPVYLAYFGMALFIGLFVLRWIRRKVKTAVLCRRCRVAAIILGLLAVFTFNENRIAARGLNREWLYPRNVIEEALHDGLFSIVPENSVIFCDTPRLWFSPEFVNAQTGKSVEIRPIGAQVAIDPAAFSGRRAYFVHFDAWREDSGWLFFAPVEEFRSNVLAGTQLIGTHPEILIYSRSLGAGEQLPVPKVEIKSPEGQVVALNWRLQDRGGRPLPGRSQCYEVTAPQLNLMTLQWKP